MDPSIADEYIPWKQNPAAGPLLSAIPLAEQLKISSLVLPNCTKEIKLQPLFHGFSLALATNCNRGPWKTLHISSTRINQTKTQLLLTYTYYTVNSMNIGINWLLPTSGTGRPLVSHGHHGCNAMADLVEQQKRHESTLRPASEGADVHGIFCWDVQKGHRSIWCIICIYNITYIYDTYDNTW